MQSIDIKNYLYHGIVDWLNYDNDSIRDNFCLEKLEGILKARHIYRPCDFKKNGITHDDYANVYTYYLTFVACHPDSLYAKVFKKDNKEDNGYLVATSYSKFGIVISPKILEELTIFEDTFCDCEIVIDGNISLDDYGSALYVDSSSIKEDTIDKLNNLLVKYGYEWDIVDIFDGRIINKNKSSDKVKINK